MPRSQTFNKLLQTLSNRETLRKLKYAQHLLTQNLLLIRSILSHPKLKNFMQKLDSATQKSDMKRLLVYLAIYWTGSLVTLAMILNDPLPQTPLEPCLTTSKTNLTI